MSDVVTRQIGKSGVSAFTKELEGLLDKINENGRLARETDKEIRRLRKLNDRSFEKMKRAVEQATRQKSMFEKFIQAVRDLAYFSEQARRNNDELKDLRKKHEETALAIQRLAFEIQRLKENEAHEREKLVLRVENALLKVQDQKASKPRNQKRLPG